MTDADIETAINQYLKEVEKASRIHKADEAVVTLRRVILDIHGSTPGLTEKANEMSKIHDECKELLFNETNGVKACIEKAEANAIDLIRKSGRYPKNVPTGRDDYSLRRMNIDEFLTMRTASMSDEQAKLAFDTWVYVIQHNAQ